jgi:hypothetical protein
MATQRTDRAVIREIHLDNAGRPFNIYFHELSDDADGIRMGADGVHRYLYNQRNLLLPIHCESSPAILYRDGSFAWMMHGFYHNPNGPAIVSQDGKVKQYWLNGSLYSEYDYFKMIDSDYDRSAALMPEDIGALMNNTGADDEKSEPSNPSLMEVAALALGVAAFLSSIKHSKKQHKIHTVNIGK